MTAVAVRVLGCPWWCTLGDDHDDLEKAGESLCHRGDASEVGGVQPQSAADWTTGEGTEGPGITTTLTDLMTPDEARTMAAALLRAADLIDTTQDGVRRRIGATVTAHLVHRGVTPEWLAEQIGMSTSNLQRRLAGTSTFTSLDMWHLATALDVEVGALYD